MAVYYGASMEITQVKCFHLKHTYSLIQNHAYLD